MKIISFMISLNFNYYLLKLIKKNLNIYKLIIKKNLLILYLKTFVKKKV